MGDTMPTLPHLTKQKILDMATSDVYARGNTYYAHDRVQNVTRQGDTIYAEVEGSDEDPYEVVVSNVTRTTWSISCTCPYDWGGICKHSVALLLYCLHGGDTISVVPAVTESLTALTRDQLVDLVGYLAEGDRTISARVVQWLSLVGTVQSATSTSKTVEKPTLPDIDAATLRRSLKPQRSRSRSRYDEDEYGYGYGILPNVLPVLETCRLYLNAGDGKNALIALEVLAEIVTEAWAGAEYYDDDGFYDAAETVGNYLTEALLLADLPRRTRNQWRTKIEKWSESLENLDMNGVFTVAAEAAEYGWDAPDLQEILQGRTLTYENDDLFEDETLTDLRLVVLERQQRWQEAFNLATYWGEDQVVATALWGLGQQSKAVNHALTDFQLASQSLAFATFLYGEGEIDAALHVAERGLGLEGEHDELGRWLIPLAEAQGKRDLALTAAKAAFRSAIRLDTYEDLQRLAGEGWPPLRSKILNELANKRGGGQHDNVLRILMREGKVDDAIAVLERELAYNSHAKRILIEEGIESKRPRWVIKAALEEASIIMNQGKSELYEVAAQWLERVRDGYLALDDYESWNDLIKRLIEEHKRKYKLVPLLKKL